MRTITAILNSINLVQIEFRSVSNLSLMYSKFIATKKYMLLMTSVYEEISLDIPMSRNIIRAIL